MRSMRTPGRRSCCWRRKGTKRAAPGSARYLEELRPLTLAVQGADLVAAGIAPGSRIGEALRATRQARLDGRIAAAEELPYALAFLAGKPA